MAQGRQHRQQSGDETPLTPRQKRRRRHAETVDEILTIAREMMQKDGVAALSFNALARRMGMRPPSLYTYFASKEAIYDTLFRRGFALYDRLQDERRAQGLSLRENLLAAVESYLNFAQQNPDLYQLMFQRPVPHFEPSAESMAVSLAALDKARTELRELVASDALRMDLPVDEATDLVIAMIHGLTELHLANDPTLPVGQGRYGKLGPKAVDLFLAAWHYRPEVEQAGGKPHAD